MIKYLIFLIFFFKCNLALTAQDKVLESILLASDIDCLINFTHKISNKEQEKVRKYLVKIAETVNSKEEIYGHFINDFSHLKLTSKHLQNDCLIDRLYSNKNDLHAFIIDFQINKSELSFKNKLSDTHIKHLSTLLQLRTLFVLNYAYFDEKKDIFNQQWQKAVDNIIASSTLNEGYSIRSILYSLEDPHVTYRDIAPKIQGLIRNDSIKLFPFRFRVENNELFIETVKDSERKLSQDTVLVENNMKVLEINGVSSKVWIDSVNRRAGPFFEDGNGWIANWLFYYYFIDEPANFRVISPKTTKEVQFEIQKKFMSMQDYESIFMRKISQKDILTYKRPHFHYTQYFIHNNKSLSALLKSLEVNDTLVLDFRGYPNNDLFSATQLLWGEKQKQVAYSLLKQPSTGCFEIREEMDSYNDKQMKDRIEIQNKKYVVYGIIGKATNSYVETAVMTCKVYTPNFTLIGHPSAGALGAINTYKLGEKVEITYPYHKFMFYSTKQMNEKNQIVPDIRMNQEEILTFLKYGILKEN